MQYTFTVNGHETTVDTPEDKPLLWVLREELGLTGAKYGCGIARCGACTVHVNGQPMRSCITPIPAVVGQAVTTIEGNDSAAGLAVQAAWRDLDVVQCGYCQSGQIMSATALLANNGKPSDNDIDAAMRGNLCRCGTYQRIRAAIHRAADELEG